MRHLIGLALALALAAAVFFVGAWGYLRLLRIPVVNGAAATLPAGGGSLLHDKNVLLAFAAVAGTALFAGVCIAAPRISPLAPGQPDAPWTPVESSSLLSDWTETAPISPQQGPQPSTDPPPW